MIVGTFRKFLLRVCGFLCLVAPAAGYAQSVRISKLTDVAFGTISNFSADAVNSQNICIFSSSGRYSVTATGSGTGGAFNLASGGQLLAYEVQWAAVPNQTLGTALLHGVELMSLTTSAGNQNCNPGQQRTASLITILRATAASAASAGSYSGTLTLLIRPN